MSSVLLCSAETACARSSRTVYTDRCWRNGLLSRRDITCTIFIVYNPSRSLLVHWYATLQTLEVLDCLGLIIANRSKCIRQPQYRHLTCLMISHDKSPMVSLRWLASLLPLYSLCKNDHRRIEWGGIFINKIQRFTGFYGRCE